MKAALLPDRGVVKVAGDGARNFLHGLVTADILKLTPGAARFCALLTPQGKIIADFIVVESTAPQGGQGGGNDGGFFLDMPRALAASLVEKLNLYKLRAKVLHRGYVRDARRARGLGRAKYNAKLVRPNTA